MLTTTTTHKLVCPDHKIPLVLKGNGTLMFHACPQCLGFWFSKTHLCSLRITEDILKKKNLLDLGFSFKSSRSCPQCRTSVMMIKDVRGVEVDVCLSCLGVWLDAGELHKLSGGKQVAYSRKGDFDFDLNGIDVLSSAGDLVDLAGSALELLGEALGGLDIGL